MIGGVNMVPDNRFPEIDMKSPHQKIHESPLKNDSAMRMGGMPVGENLQNDIGVNAGPDPKNQ